MSDVSFPCSDSEQMEQVLRVKKVAGTKALVEGARISACQTCQQKSACGTAATTSYAKNNVNLWIPNHLNARPGDFVAVGLPASAVLLAATMAYLLPPFAMVVVAIFCTVAGASEVQSALWSLIALIFGLSGTQAFSYLIEKKPTAFQMLRVTEHAYEKASSNSLSNHQPLEKY